jgi:hypothetical protein
MTEGVGSGCIRRQNESRTILIHYALNDVDADWYVSVFSQNVLQLLASVWMHDSSAHIIPIIARQSLNQMKVRKCQHCTI